MVDVDRGPNWAWAQHEQSKGCAIDNRLGIVDIRRSRLAAESSQVRNSTVGQHLLVCRDLGPSAWLIFSALPVAELVAAGAPKQQPPFGPLISVVWSWSECRFSGVETRLAARWAYKASSYSYWLVSICYRWTGIDLHAAKALGMIHNVLFSECTGSY